MFRVAQKFYADNGTWLAHSSLVPVLPQIADASFGAIGLRYKPAHWEAWSPAGPRPPSPRALGAPAFPPTLMATSSRPQSHGGALPSPPFCVLPAPLPPTLPPDVVTVVEGTLGHIKAHPFIPFLWLALLLWASLAGCYFWSRYGEDIALWVEVQYWQLHRFFDEGQARARGWLLLHDEQTVMQPTQNSWCQYSLKLSGPK